MEQLEKQMLEAANTVDNNNLHCKTYEFFTPKYTIIIQAHDMMEAVEKFSAKYVDRVVQVIDVDFFKVKKRE